MRVLTGEVRQRAAHALASGNSQSYFRATHLLNELQSWFSDVETEELPSGQAPIFRHASSGEEGTLSQLLGDQEPDGLLDQDSNDHSIETTIPLETTPSGSHGPGHRAFLPDLGFLDEEDRQIFRQSWRQQSLIEKHNRSIRSSPRLTAMAQENRSDGQGSSANPAASPTRHDYKQHALLRYYKTSCSEVVVKIEPLGSSTSSTTSSREHASAPSTRPSTRVDLLRSRLGLSPKRRRITTATSEATFSQLNHPNRSNIPGRVYADPAQGMSDIHWILPLAR